MIVFRAKKYHTYKVVTNKMLIKIENNSEITITIAMEQKSQ